MNRMNYAVLVFGLAAGAAAGIMADRSIRNQPESVTRIVRDFSSVLDSLDLSPDQRARAESVLTASAPRSEEVLRDAAARLRDVADSADAALRALLTPAQQERLNRLRREPTFLIKRKLPEGGEKVDTVKR